MDPGARSHPGRAAHPPGALPLARRNGEKAGVPPYRGRRDPKPSRDCKGAVSVARHHRPGARSRRRVTGRGGDARSACVRNIFFCTRTARPRTCARRSGKARNASDEGSGRSGGHDGTLRAAESEMEGSGATECELVIDQASRGSIY